MFLRMLRVQEKFKSSLVNAVDVYACRFYAVPLNIGKQVAGIFGVFVAVFSERDRDTPFIDGRIDILFV